MTHVLGYNHSRYYQILSNLEQIAFSKNYQPLYLSPFEKAAIEPSSKDHLPGEGMNALSGFSGFAEETSPWKWLSPKGELLQFQTDPTRLATAFAAKQVRSDIQKYVYSTQVFHQTTESETGLSPELIGGIEYYGQRHYEADFEVISVLLSLFRELQLGDLHLELGHAGFLKSWFDTLALSPKLVQSILMAIERKNKMQLMSITREAGIPLETEEKLLSLLKAFGSPEQVLSFGKTLALNPGMEQALVELEALCSRFSNQPSLKLQLDLSFANRHNYYTGPVYKLYSLQSHQPIATGGRYDRLADAYGVSLPACGANLILPNILEVIEMNQKQNGKNTLRYALYFDNNNLREAQQLKSALEELGLKGDFRASAKDQMDLNLKEALLNINLSESSAMVTDTKQPNWILSLVCENPGPEPILSVIDPALNQSYKTTIPVFLSQVTPLVKWQSIH